MCADEKTDVKRLELCVKMFLNACVDFSQHLEKKKRRRGKNQSSPLKEAEPFYVKGNFISLLNLPTQIQRCGRLGGLWDGELERNIQGVKPSLSHLRKNSSFLQTKLTGIRQDKYFDLIWRKWFESNNDQSDSIERNWFIGTYRVSNRNEVHDRLNRGDVLPCLQLSTGLYIPFGKSKGEVNVVEVSVDSSANGLQLAGQVYRKLAVGQTSTVTHEEVKNADGFGVLLPHLSTDEALFDQHWTIITNDRLSFGLDSDSFDSPWYHQEIFRNVIPPSTLNRSLVGHKIGMVCRYEEVNSNNETVGFGLQYYTGEIITFNGRGRFGIMWQSSTTTPTTTATEESTETTVELLCLNNYGTFKERGWVIL
jgi:hypothetical protein